MGQLLHLESFDADQIAQPAAHPEFLRGHAQGYLDGAAQEQSEQAIQAEKLANLLTEARFSYAEARQAVLTDLSAIIDASLSQLLPAMATAGLASLIREELDNRFAQSADPSLKLSVAPDLVALCETLTADHKIRVQADPMIGSHAVWFESESNDSCIDFENILSAVQTAILSLTAQPLRTQEHG